MYLASSIYVPSANDRDVPGQALMWIISTMTQAITTSAIWKAFVIAAIPARRAEIIHVREKITRTKSMRTVRLPKRTRPQLDITDHGK
jgi:hypothetical protein